MTEQGQSTRERNMIRRSEAEAKSAESKERIMAMLAEVSKDPTATLEEKLEAARLAVELQRGH